MSYKKKIIAVKKKTVHIYVIMDHKLVFDNVFEKHKETLFSLEFERNENLNMMKWFCVHNGWKELF